VLPRANFKVVGRDSFPVIPPGPGESASISFEVQPTHAPEGEVWVVVWQNQSLLATLALKPRIVEAEIKVSRKTSATASAAEASPPDAPLQRLVIMEEQRGSETFFNFVLHAPALDIEDVYPSMPIKGDRREYVENLYRQIEDYWESNRDEAEAFAAELRAFGGQLFRELFPTDLQRVLWERRQEIKSIMVLSTEPFIPWELVHLKEPGRAGMPSEELFLGQMGLVRWLFGAGTAPLHMKIRKGRVCYVIPQYPDERYRLPEAEMESEFLRATFNAAEVEPQPNPVRELISRPGGFDLLHFACHGAAEQNNISNGRLLLEGDMKGGEYEPAFLSATTAEQYSNLRAADNRPMVVVNACQAGRAGYKLSGIGGFAQAFLKGGAGAFVGTLWSVGDRPARVFTETLYAELLRGANLSEAATIARRAARQEGVATWLAYVVYGHPHMRVND
jgi:hypothetical protein